MEQTLVLNVEAIEQTLGKEVLEEALNKHGYEGLQKLQELMGLASCEAIKALLDNDLQVERLIDVTKENGVLYVRLILKITQYAESGGEITNRIEKAVELLKMPPSEALKELRAIQQAQRKRLLDQVTISARSNKKVTDYEGMRDDLKNKRELAALRTQATREQTQATALRNSSRNITNAVNRIDTIVNPRKWAQLPCFAGETSVWTVDGVKRTDELQPGEKVWPFDGELQQTVQRQILKVLQNRTVHFYDVQVGSSTIQATGNHPFWVEDRSE
jgi:hypothetical protein